VNGGNLASDARRDGNDVTGDECVVGGFVREKVRDGFQTKIQQ